MIEVVLIVFLVSVAAVATVTVKVGLKAIDFIEATYGFYNRVEAQQKEIIRLLQGSEFPPKEGV